MNSRVVTLVKIEMLFLHKLLTSVQAPLQSLCNQAALGFVRAWLGF